MHKNPLLIRALLLLALPAGGLLAWYSIDRALAHQNIQENSTSTTQVETVRKRTPIPSVKKVVRTETVESMPQVAAEPVEPASTAVVKRTNSSGEKHQPTATHAAPAPAAYRAPAPVAYVAPVAVIPASATPQPVNPDIAFYRQAGQTLERNPHEAAQLASQMAPSPERNYLISAAFQRMGAINYGAAIQIASQAQDEELRVIARTSAAAGLAMSGQLAGNPELEARVLQMSEATLLASESRQAIRASQELEHTLAAADSQAASALASQWAERDPAAASALASQLPEGAGRDQQNAAYAAAARVTREQAAASTWATQLPSELNQQLAAAYAARMASQTR